MTGARPCSHASGLGTLGTHGLSPALHSENWTARGPPHHHIVTSAPLYRSKAAKSTQIQMEWTHPLNFSRETPLQKHHKHFSSLRQIEGGSVGECWRWRYSTVLKLLLLTGSEPSGQTIVTSQACRQPTW